MDLNVYELYTRKQPCIRVYTSLFKPKLLILLQALGLITRRSKVQILPPPPAFATVCWFHGFLKTPLSKHCRSIKREISDPEKDRETQNPAPFSMSRLPEQKNRNFGCPHGEIWIFYHRESLNQAH